VSMGYNFILLLGRGHLDCLQYTHEHGCPWDVFRCFADARGDCVAYLDLVAAAAESTYS
jgi:hypothetical protein